jgi:putative transposase
MPRRSRIFIEGLSSHVIQRGNNRITIFQRAQDYEVFLELLRRATVRNPVAVHAFVLMTNHFHLLVTPTTEDALPQFMKDVDGSYVYYYNRAHQRIGTLWNGRYRGILIENVSYLLTCLRYIEQNPVRAGMVRTPEAYRWSSYAAHAFGRWPERLTAHPLYRELGSCAEARQLAYRHWCGLPLPNDHLSLLR